MTTPIPRILLAVDGKVEFTNKTNPFGSREDSGSAELGGVGWKKPSRQTTAEKIKAAFGGRARKANRK